MSRIQQGHRLLIFRHKWRTVQRNLALIQKWSLRLIWQRKMIVCLSSRVLDANWNSAILMISCYKRLLQILGCIPQRCSKPLSSRCLITQVLDKDMFIGTEFIRGIRSLTVFSPQLDLIASSKSLHYKATDAFPFPRINHRRWVLNKPET